MSAWPPLGQERLADAVAALAERVAEPDVRAQLHALSAVVRNLGAESRDREARAGLERSLADALAEGDEGRILDAARRLAALDRAAVRPVDWTAASGG